MFLFFFLNKPAPPEISPLPLPAALPIPAVPRRDRGGAGSLGGSRRKVTGRSPRITPPLDRKSTRLNSSHSQISYAVFCLKKKKRTEDDVEEMLTYRPLVVH